MRPDKIIRLAIVLVLATGMIGILTPIASAQSVNADETGLQQSGQANDVIELPSLIIDLFRSTPSGPAEAAPSQPATPSAATSPASTQSAPLANLGSNPPLVATTGDYVPDEVLVTVSGDGQSVQDIANSLGLQVRSVRTSFLLGTSLVRFGIPDGRPVGLVLAQLNLDGRTSNSEPNHIYSLQQAESVSGYALESISFNPGDANGASIRLAVIDAGRDKTHPALANITAIDFDALPDTPVVNTDHGTSIVGLIAGQDGFQGVAPGAHIYHARAFENGKSNADAILAALDWSAEQNVQIINMSFVGPRNRLFEQACNAAFERDILLVAAAGNNGPDAPSAYPGAYKSVIAVTATDQQNRRMAQANIGSYIAISAPGVGVLAPIPGGGFDAVTGTSFAAAIYSGAIANLLQRQPGQSSFEVGRVAAKTALDLGKKGKDSEFGFGLINFTSATQAMNR